MKIMSVVGRHLGHQIVLVITELERQQRGLRRCQGEWS